MAILRKTVLATALAAAGLASTAGVALANDHVTDGFGGTDGPTVQKGLLNSSDFAPNTPINACNNNIPLNLVGLQIPLQDLALNIPLLSSAERGNSATNSKSCANPIAQDN